MIKSTKTRKITKQHIILILLSVIILLPNILACFLANNLGTVWNRLFYLLCSLIVFLIPALIFRARTFLVLNTVTICLGLFEMVHLITNKATTSLLFVYTILISEPGEALELISSGWPVILLYLLLLTGYFFLIFKVINNDYLFQKKTRIILAATFSALFLGSFGIWKWLDKKEIETYSTSEVAEGIIKIREGKVLIEPGYDGVYGKIKIFEKAKQKQKIKQKILF